MGDLFGGINALFSGLAFAGVITTLVLQSLQLTAQKEELAVQKEELQRATKLGAISALLSSVNTQLHSGDREIRGEVLDTLQKARLKYQWAIPQDFA